MARWLRCARVSHTTPPLPSAPRAHTRTAHTHCRGYRAVITTGTWFLITCAAYSPSTPTPAAPAAHFATFSVHIPSRCGSVTTSIPSTARNANNFIQAHLLDVHFVIAFWATPCTDLSQPLPYRPPIQHRIKRTPRVGGIPLPRPPVVWMPSPVLPVPPTRLHVQRSQLVLAARVLPTSLFYHLTYLYACRHACAHQGCVYFCAVTPSPAFLSVYSPSVWHFSLLNSWATYSRFITPERKIDKDISYNVRLSQLGERCTAGTRFSYKNAKNLGMKAHTRRHQRTIAGIFVRRILTLPYLNNAISRILVARFLQFSGV